MSANYIYLHGFASSPLSSKATYLHSRFAGLGINLKIPNLNAGDFSHLTLTRQLRQVEALFPEKEVPVTIIGSSFGGLTAAWLAQQHPQVERIVLLAPAFGFIENWLPTLSEAEVKDWQESGYRLVYHYAKKQQLPIHYEIITDVAGYQEEELQRSLPTLILHGIHDDTIPVSASRNYAQNRPWVKLIELDSDHALNNVLPEIWEAIQAFCQVPVEKINP
ncbi:MAG: YqiA/YcfP family alpha/beta fold hydrolase [Oscillatoria sp. PMC 1068.18]|nr:YqiA/YcfP family alpha/beta fold hydrolase [Oscillatoria sp. PMC 1076.18]MEC4989825.1 YqiA/YcfP family alpha/beta fold hydrolase [Oscillatoria sp. PMC 1068.18]